MGLVLTLLFSFFFTTVAANAIATTANNPASGMTMLTVIVSAVVLLKFGLSGTTGMFFVMALAGMVCVALCVSGQFITDLKAGYWIGSTPSAQEKVKFIGVVASAITAGLTIVLLAKAFQFGEAAPGDVRQVLVAPQASALKALVEGFMSGQPVAYVLFGIGAMITVVLEMLGLSSMVFALGIYLPLQLTTPILVGGFLSHLVNKRADKTGGERGRSIRERGVIIAGGLMAGGALGGVFGAALRLLPKYREDLIQTPFYNNEPISQTISAIMFVGLCLYIWFSSLRGKKDCIMDQVGRYVADAVLGIDTLWGGDVMCSVRHRTLHRRLVVLRRAAARRLHHACGRDACARPAASAARPSIAKPSKHICARSICRPPSPAFASEADKIGGLRGQYLAGLADLPARPCGTSPWRSSARRQPVPYERCVEASTGKPPEPSQAGSQARARCRVAEPRRLFRRTMADCWARSTPGAASASRPWPRCKALGAAVIAYFDNLSAANLLPYLAEGTGATCRAPTSTSCRSRTPGSPAR